jgi:hypothetical protein
MAAHSIFRTTLFNTKHQRLTAEVLQGVLDGQLDVFGVVVQLKQLGSNEDVFALDARVLDALADFGFVAVRPGAAVTCQLFTLSSASSGRMPLRSAKVGDKEEEAKGYILDVAVARLQGVLDGLGDFSGPVSQLCDFALRHGRKDPATSIFPAPRWLLGHFLDITAPERKDLPSGDYSATNRYRKTHLDCQVPRPTEGISCPVESLNEGVAIVRNCNSLGTDRGEDRSVVRRVLDRVNMVLRYGLRSLLYILDRRRCGQVASGSTHLVLFFYILERCMIAEERVIDIHRTAAQIDRAIEGGEGVQTERGYAPRWHLAVDTAGSSLTGAVREERRG